MRAISFIPAALILALLASCASQEENFKVAAPIMKESPTARAQVTAKCMAQPMQPEALEQVAFYVKAQKSEAQKLFCQRLTNGFAAGKITYDDFKALFQKKMVTPALVRVLRGN